VTDPLLWMSSNATHSVGLNSFISL
jgi:hypothetical protein